MSDERCRHLSEETKQIGQVLIAMCGQTVLFLILKLLPGKERQVD